MFDQLRHRLSGETKLKPTLVELNPDNLNKLGLAWNSRFNLGSLRRHLQGFPGLSFRVMGHEEYIIGDNWRRHEKIGQIVEVKARYYRKELVESLVEQFQRRGFNAVILNNEEYFPNARFYEEEGFIEVERIAYYEKLDMQIQYHQRLTSIFFIPYSPAKLADLMSIDKAAFPWLWNNSPKEFDYYSAQEDVNIFLCYTTEDKKPTGYFSFTMFDHWAHLDRMAVAPEFQGQGIGACQLGYALELMGKSGAKRVTLSTQITNQRSQNLYERFGFHRIDNLEYSLMGRWFK